MNKVKWSPKAIRSLNKLIVFIDLKWASKIVEFVIFWALLIQLNLNAQNVVFIASVSKNPVAVGKQLKLTFSLNASGSGFRAYGLDDFTVISGPNRSTSMQWLNDSFRQSLFFSYDLVAEKEGKYSIGPASVTVYGKTVQSNTIAIDVVEGFPKKLSALEQNLFFIGDKSYLSTEKFTLSLNTDYFFNNEELGCIIAKKGVTGIIAFSLKEAEIRGKAIMYLDDATMISLIDRGIYDYVDGIGTTVFYLTTKEIEKLKTVNINKVRFSTRNGDFRASNSSIEGLGEEGRVDVPSLVKNLFVEKKYLK